MEFGTVILGLVVVVIGVVMLITGKKSKAKKISATDEVVQEMRWMKASSIKDAVEILDELADTSPGYKHYVELNGVTGTDNPVVTPFSAREVAFYDANCYEIIEEEGSSKENLVAHERSVDQFYFTDGSCNTKVYVDLESFGGDVALVSLCDRIEGPDSDVSQRLFSGSGGSRRATYCMADDQSWSSSLFDFVNSLSNKAYVTLMSLIPQTARPALACCGAGAGSIGSNISLFAGPRGGTFGGGGMPRGGAPRGGMPRGGAPKGGFGAPPRSGGFGAPPRNSGGFGGGGGSTIGGIVIGMALSSLMEEIANTENVSYDRFRGYHFVENGIPLNHQVYTIGELHKVGDRVILRKAAGEHADACYFSTRPEEEVIAIREAKAKANNLGCAVGLIIFGAIIAAFGVYSYISGAFYYF